MKKAGSLEPWWSGNFVDPLSKRHLHKACVQVLRTDGTWNEYGCRCAKGTWTLGMRAWEPQPRSPCSVQQRKIEQTFLKGSF